MGERGEKPINAAGQKTDLPPRGLMVRIITRGRLAEYKGALLADKAMLEQAQRILTELEILFARNADGSTDQPEVLDNLEKARIFLEEIDPSPLFDKRDTPTYVPAAKRRESKE